ncbi:hypothetical protein SDRG_10223 [Saprolegnia diclina VS20]|uniref:WRKY transcription factor 19 n=1 Tax=Saprolegnia diclina (strain VS20) TaxID=1156394 RepID=T0Q2H6_SAPDV|nr:hypothetical protein SDRG_10223 [Saprolegnia diclina VS20]EQC32024.1 hypothetical protein SDRG_10223 [Saprolegnia diclina VS20]|eukprot:XP_008614426.1 hypothetical protein SDRG_10223 [Saprolegnia diclina VS20]
MLDLHTATLLKRGATVACIFNECTKEAVYGSTKCSFHKRRKRCSVLNCSNQAYARDLCVRHGGKRKCAHPMCSTAAHGGPYCVTHGGASGKRLCSIEGCPKQAHAHRRCVRHGGGRLCTVDGCAHYARGRGVCRSHGAKPSSSCSSPISVSSGDDSDTVSVKAELLLDLDVSATADFLHSVVDDSFLRDLHTIAEMC